MNSSFDGSRFARGRFLVVVAALLLWCGAAREASALNVHAVYRTACSRELGVILRVEKRKIHLLRLDGTLVEIPRHEIVSLLYYPLSKLPVSNVPTPEGFPPLRVQTRFNEQVVDLVTGWPIDYSENQIAFLRQNGEEMLVDRDSLWSLSYETVPQAKRSATSQPTGGDRIVFVHPQTSGFCEAQGEDRADARPIFAQQILNDQVVIRRELDRLHEGYEQIVEYEGDQKFYPVPFLYKDKTMLGLWVSLGSRYGASKDRTNNYTPLIVDELALGPFRYQHRFLSGAAPNDMLLHQEAQSQIFYRFKAAYFHTAVFFDPNLLLVGPEKYQWSAEDLEDEKLDDRINESLAIEFGFDWGPLVIELSPAVLGQAAVKFGDVFDTTTELNLWRLGFRLIFPTWNLHASIGRAHTSGYIQLDRGEEELYLDNDWTYAYGRVDLGVRPLRPLEVSLSAVMRSLDYELDTLATYDSFSLSTAAQASYALGHRFSVGGHVIIEVHNRQVSGSPKDTRVLPRVGVFTGFWF